MKPVNNVLRVNEYRDSERDRQRHSQSFEQILAEVSEEKRESQKKESSAMRHLEIMGGLNQYTKDARPVCFVLYNETDFKA